jgi:hypothetical protein
MTAPASAPAGLRRWALSSLVAGGVWLVLAVAPTLVTTLIGLPFGVYALAAGWLSLAGCKRAAYRPGARMAAWGVGLGCAGFVWQLLYVVILGSLLAASVAALVNSFVTGTPIP